MMMSKRAKKQMEKINGYKLQQEEFKKLRAVGYCRVSTDGQEENGTSLESQYEAIESFAKSQGYELIGIFQDAESGAVEPNDRVGFGRILDLVNEKEFDVLLVWKFDRLSRSIKHSVVAVNELQENGVILKSVTEPIDTSSAIGQTIFSVLAGMAQLERENITIRTKTGRKKKAEKGGYACGVTPLGYVRTEDGLAINEDEAKAVKRIYELRNQGLSLRNIAKTLTEEGFMTKKGGQWYASTVTAILDNVKYKGYTEYVFKDRNEPIITKGQHEAIVPMKSGDEQC